MGPRPTSRLPESQQGFCSGGRVPKTVVTGRLGRTYYPEAAAKK